MSLEQTPTTANQGWDKNPKECSFRPDQSGRNSVATTSCQKCFSLTNTFHLRETLNPRDSGWGVCLLLRLRRIRRLKGTLAGPVVQSECATHAARVYGYPRNILKFLGPAVARSLLLQLCIIMNIFTIETNVVGANSNNG